MFSMVTKGTRPQKATVGYHSDKVDCRVAWNDKYGLWVMYPPKTWDKNLLVIGTHNPKDHPSGSLSITCQINLSKNSTGGLKAGAVLSNGKDVYLGHTGGIGGSKPGGGKAAFLNWYRDRISDTVD